MTQLFHRLHIALVLLILVGLPLPAAELPTEAKQAEAAFDSELRQKVEPPYEEGIKALRARYRQAIEAALKSASSMGRLDESLALKEELLHTVKGDSVPETDEPGTNSEVVRLRGIWRQEKERMDKERNARLKGIAEQHDAVMRRIEERLTRELKLEDAKAVRERRDSLEQIVKAGAASGLPKADLSSASGPVSSPAFLKGQNVQNAVLLDDNMTSKWSYLIEPEGAARGLVVFTQDGKAEFTGMHKNPDSGAWEQKMTPGAWTKGKKMNQLIVTFPDYSWDVRIENGIGKMDTDMGARYLKPNP